MITVFKKIGSGGGLKRVLLGGFFIATGINLYAFQALANSCSDFQNFTCQSPLKANIGGSYWCDEYIQTYLGKSFIQRSQTGAISCNPDVYNTPQNVEDEAFRLFGTPKVLIKNCISPGGWYPVITAGCYNPAHRFSASKTSDSSKKSNQSFLRNNLFGISPAVVPAVVQLTSALKYSVSAFKNSNLAENKKLDSCINDIKDQDLCMPLLESFCKYGYLNNSITTPQEKKAYSDCVSSGSSKCHD